MHINVHETLRLHFWEHLVILGPLFSVPNFLAFSSSVSLETEHNKMINACKCRGFRGCGLPGEITDVLTWRESGDCALHDAPAVPAWTDHCQLQQRTAGNFSINADNVSVTV